MVILNGKRRETLLFRLRKLSRIIYVMLCNISLTLRNHYIL